MSMKNKIAVLGGDLRQYTAALELSKRKWDVVLWGMDVSENNETNITRCVSLDAAIEGAFGVVLPLPASADGIYLNCPFSTNQDKVSLSKLIGKISPDCMIIGGRIPQETVVLAEDMGIDIKDYFISEEFQIKNAYITAEAALSIAMNSLNKNLCDTRVAITGYGRIAKHLIRLLSAIGADITVAARKTSDLAWSASSGCSVVRIGDSEELKHNIYSLAHGYDIIYNTVPHRLFDEDFLRTVDKNTFIIDLASVPGGVDIRGAKALGSNVLWATSLPGKYAPVSAGELIACCVDGILRGEAVSEI